MMLRMPSEADRSTSVYAAAMWIWTAVAILATAIIAGTGWPNYDGYNGISDMHWGAFFGGLVLGAFSTVPLWALYGLGKHIHRNVITLRTELAQQASQVAPEPRA